MWDGVNGMKRRRWRNRGITKGEELEQEGGDRERQSYEGRGKGWVGGKNTEAIFIVSSQVSSNTRPKTNKKRRGKGSTGKFTVYTHYSTYSERGIGVYFRR